MVYCNLNCYKGTQWLDHPACEVVDTIDSDTVWPVTCGCIAIADTFLPPADPTAKQGYDQLQLPGPDGPELRPRARRTVAGLWFQAPVDFDIVALSVPADNGKTENMNQVIQVVRFVSEPGNRYPRSGVKYRTLYYGHTGPGAEIVQRPPIRVQAGEYIGVLGARYADIEDPVLYVMNSDEDGPYCSQLLEHGVQLTRLEARSRTRSKNDVFNFNDRAVSPRTHHLFSKPTTGPARINVKVEAS